MTYLLGTTCLTTCPNSTYPTTSPNLCNSCDPKCYLCSGPSSSQCSMCTTSGADEAFLDGTTCVSTCPSATFANITSHTCDSCPGNCTVCTSSTICTVCDSGFGLLNSSCFSPCPDGYWLENGTICSLCDPFCALCSTSATDCSSCTVSGANEAFLLGSACINPCPTATFGNTTNHQCESCPGNCTTCTSSLICTVCDPTFGLLNSSCFNPCPDGYWF